LEAQKKPAAKVLPGTTSIKSADLEFADFLRLWMEAFRGGMKTPGRVGAN
jgi:hypothetical protein